MSKPEVIEGPVRILGEGPRWFDGALWGVDITGCLIWQLRDGNWQQWALPGMVGCLAPSEGRNLILGCADGLYRFNLDDETRSLIADPEPNREIRFNDGAVDPAGRLIAGTMPMTGPERAGSLFALDPDGRVRTLLTGIACSNGIDWNNAGDQMYYVDSPTRRLDVIDYDLSSGAIGNRRPLVDWGDVPEVPDGLTVDADGNVWIAFWGGWRIEVRDGSDGSLLETYPLPVERVTAIAFGGDDLKTCFVTSAREGLSDSEIAEQPLAGRTFACRPGAKGRPCRAFAG